MRFHKVEMAVLKEIDKSLQERISDINIPSRETETPNEKLDAATCCILAHAIFELTPRTLRL